jgi:MSHA biogenesis protein MshJ
MNTLPLLSGLQRVRVLAQAFDSRHRRERVLLCTAGVAMAFMLADSLWLTPAQRAHKDARSRLRQAQATLATLNADAERLAVMHKAQALQSQAELAQWRDKVRRGDTELREQTATLIGPQHMLPLLEELLGAHSGVKLRSAHTLARSDVLSGQAKPSADTPTLYRHGVELVLEGSFAELLAYLQALEQLPQRLLWGSLQLKVEQHPGAVMTLRLHTLSVEQQWLEI